METVKTSQPFEAARFIKEIGRGKDGARSLSRADAQQLYAAMLEGRVSDLELGALTIALRIKGESAEEIAGFLDAVEAVFRHLTPPPGPYAPVVIPSYNGARHMPNLTPLLALLLAREGVPVLVHGVLQDENRVTSAQIFQELDLPLSTSAQHAEMQMAARRPAFMPVKALAPRMARLLALRQALGVRNSTHTLIKLLQPFSGPALRLASYTHPEYLALLSEYFGGHAPAERGDAFLMRGTEGETVANARRAQQIDWFHAGACETLVPKQAAVDGVPALPATHEAGVTAAWIKDALAGAQAVPVPILEQVRQCIDVARRLRAESGPA